MVDRALLGRKIGAVRQALARVRTRQHLTCEQFIKDFDAQDVVLRNIQLAIQGCIDLASHIIADEDWRIPGSLAELVDVLKQRQVLTIQTANAMRSAIGLRNLLVHEYTELNLGIVYQVSQNQLRDIESFFSKWGVIIILVGSEGGERWMEKEKE